MEAEIGVDEPVADRQHGKYRFDAAAGPQRMAGEGFGRAHPRIVRVEEPPDSGPFGQIVILCARAVQVDIVDIAGLQSASFQRRLHG